MDRATLIVKKAYEALSDKKGEDIKIIEIGNIVRNGIILNIIRLVLADIYEDEFYFCRIFKKYTGMSPGAFRKERMQCISG